MHKIKLVSLLIVLVVNCFSCKPGNNDHEKQDATEFTNYQLQYQPFNQKTRIGDTLIFSIDQPERIEMNDTLFVTHFQQIIGNITYQNQSIKWFDLYARTGNHTFSLISSKNNKKIISSINVNLYAPQKPVSYTFKINNFKKHDIQTYTQGLVWYNNQLIESAGMYHESKIIILDELGNLKIEKKLPDEYFGEGIAIINHQIFQLTWRENTAFVYSAEKLDMVGKINYHFPEGWGLTSKGDTLLMSDGSERIYFINPETFQEYYRLEVYDDRRAIYNLNELELVGQILYANIYQTDNIAMIDIRTGSVIGWIDCTGLLKNEEKHSRIDVLNGIAYHPVSGNFYLTGKYWPKIFEVQFQKN